MKKSILIIKGYSKTEIELQNDRYIIQTYIDFFTSKAGGCFDLDTEIFIREEPSIDELKQLDFLNESDYLIILLIGHGANNNGTQVFQLNKKVLIIPGQLQFGCERQLHIIESCRNTINEPLTLERINQLKPKYKYGGVLKQPYTKEEAKRIFDEALENSPKEIVYVFACNIGESAYNYLFLSYLLKVSIWYHEYRRSNIFNINHIFQQVEFCVKRDSQNQQNPIIIGDGNLPFIITIN